MKTQWEHILQDSSSLTNTLTLLHQPSESVDHTLFVAGLQGEGGTFIILYFLSYIWLTDTIEMSVPIPP